MFLVFLVLLGLGVGIFTLRMRHERTPRPVNRYIRDYVVIAVLLAIVAFVYYLRIPGFEALLSPEVADDAESVNALRTGDRVLLAGTVSGIQPEVEDGYVALVRVSPTAPEERLTPALLLELDGCQIQFANEDYEPFEWPRHSSESLDVFYLTRDMPVVVDGVIKGPVHVTANLVFAGTVEDYRARVRRALIWPVIMSIASGASALLALAVPFVFKIMIMHRVQRTAKEVS